MAYHDANLRAAETVVDLLGRQGIPSAVIGAVALAAYKNVRFTEDLDPGIETELPALRNCWNRMETILWEVSSTSQALSD